MALNDSCSFREASVLPTYTTPSQRVSFGGSSKSVGGVSSMNRGCSLLQPWTNCPQLKNYLIPHRSKREAEYSSNRLFVPMYRCISPCVDGSLPPRLQRRLIHCCSSSAVSNSEGCCLCSIRLCTEWAEDLDQKHHVWNLCLQTAPPLGSDPAPIYRQADHPDFAVLKLLPWRIDLVNPPAEHIIWHAPPVFP